MEPDPLLASLRNAVAAMPDDVPLRLHLAALLLRREQRDEAVRHLGAVLQRDPGNTEALALLTGSQAASGPAGSTAGSPGAKAADLPPSAPADLDLSPERSRGASTEPHSPSSGAAGGAEDPAAPAAEPASPAAEPAEGY